MPQKNRTAKSVLGGLVGLVGLSAVAGLLITASVTPVLAMTGIAGTQALTIFDELPEVLKVDTPMEQSTIYATDPKGKSIKWASFYDQNRIPLTYDQVSQVMYDAILSSEDKNFYTHGGVNIGATVKALLENIRGTSSRGASTISQQYVKNVLIQQCEQGVDTADDDYLKKLQACWIDATNAVGTDGIERKLREMRYAIQIEKDYSKNDILLGYLNIANFGGTVYGIEAAANYYFSTTAAKLTAAQAATLAGIVQNPNVYRIDKMAGSTTNSKGEAINGKQDGFAETKIRRHYVLTRMLEDGKISQKQFDEADASAIEPVITEPTQGCAAAGVNAYFCQYVKSIVLNDPAFGATQQERQDLLRRGGLKIYTSMDYRIQNAASIQMRQSVPANFDNQHLGAATVSIEVGTGRILSMTQNTRFTESDTTDLAKTSIVFAADKAHAGGVGFPPGSTYKMFTLLDWLEKGHSVREVINGRVQSNLKIPGATCGGPFITDSRKIGNFGGGAGSTNTPMAFTAQSLNSGFFAMAAKLDLCDINKVADRLGVTLGDGEKVTKVNNAYDVLGSKAIAPIQMANAYATVASGGTYCTPRAIDRVVGPDGVERALPQSSCTKGVLSPGVAGTAAFALEGVMSGGTGRNGNPWDGTPLIGKTGTHNTYSTMMIESSTKVATAAWVGRWDGKANLFTSYYKGVKLSDLRYGLARAAQAAANQAYRGGNFPAPDQKLIRQVLTAVPDVVGKTVDEATKVLEDAGFTVTVGPAVDSELPTNVVAAQDPSGKAAGGATVTLSPSNGHPPMVVPDVAGQPPALAKALIEAQGFTNVDLDNSCNPPDSVASGTNPAAGTPAKANQKIKVAC